MKRTGLLKNDKILKAMTIGLSAMIAVTSTPLTALADEIDPSGDADNGTSNENNIEDSQEVVATETESVASTGIETVVDAFDETETVAAITDEFENSVNIAEETHADGLIDEIKPCTDIIEEVKEQLESAKDNISGENNSAKSNLETAVTEEKSFNENLNNAKEDIKAAGDMADEAKNISDEAKKIEEKHLDEINAKIDEIENAVSLESAKTFYEEALKIVDDANSDYSKALSEYENKIKEYEAIKKDYSEVLKSLYAAKDAYSKAVGNAGENVESAVASLRNAIAAEKSLKDKAQDAYDDMTNDAGVILSKAESEAQKAAEQAVAKKNDKLLWSGLDKMFDTYVLEYYIPVFLRYGTDVTIEANAVTDKDNGFTKDSNDSTFNYKLYKIVKIDENGNREEIDSLKLNYKREGREKITIETEDGKEMTGIYIFQKDKKESASTKKENYYGLANNAYLDYDDEVAKTLAENDESLRKFINNSLETRKNLQEVQDSKADMAVKELEASLEAVITLQKQIEGLQKKYNIECLADIADIESLASALEEKIAALDKNIIGTSKDKEEKEYQLKEAKEILDEINNKLADIEKAYAGVVDELTPDEEPDTDSSIVYGGTSYTVAAPLYTATAALPVAGVAGARIAGPAANIIKGEEEVVVSAKDKKRFASDLIDLKKDSKLTTIIDDEVALAAIPDEAKNDMNWWWLVIVALLGATGYELYKKHEEKKEKAN